MSDGCWVRYAGSSRSISSGSDPRAGRERSHSLGARTMSDDEDISVPLLDAWKRQGPELQDLLQQLVENLTPRPKTLNGLTSALTNDDRRTREIACFILNMIPILLGVRHSYELSLVVTRLLKEQMSEGAPTVLRYESVEVKNVAVEWTNRRWWLQQLTALACKVRTVESLEVAG